MLTDAGRPIGSAATARMRRCEGDRNAGSATSTACAGHRQVRLLTVTSVPKPASGYDLRLSRRLRDQIRDRVGLRYEGNVACFHLDRLRAHALRLVRRNVAGKVPQECLLVQPSIIAGP